MANKASYSEVLLCEERDGLGELMCKIVPLACSIVIVSTRHPCFKLTSSPCLQRKLAPIMGMRMSAVMKIHQNACRRPKSSIRERVPYIVMGEPLTARSSDKSCLFFQSIVDGGITLTSAPVSIRKWHSELLSVRNSR